MPTTMKMVIAMWGAPKAVRPVEPEGPDPDQSPDLPYELAQQRLQRQLDSVDVLDTKMTNTFTGAVALVALLGVVFALRSDSLTGAKEALFYVAVSITGLITLLFGSGTLARGWYTGPSPSEIVRYYDELGADEVSVKWLVTRNLIGSFEQNGGALIIKICLLRICAVLLVVEAGFVVAALIAVAS